jgi:hypothetical protein
MTSGIFVLADDGAMPWIAACLASIRRQTSLPITVIPFGGPMRRVARFAERYGCDVFGDASELQRLDLVGCAFAPFYRLRNARAIGMFRKYACWSGPYERFLFLDADTLLLSDPGPLLARAEITETPLWFTDLDIEGSFAPGPTRDRLLASGASPGNLGVFVSHRDAFRLHANPDLLMAAEQDRDVFTPWADQTVVNWLLNRDASGTRSLLDLGVGPSFVRPGDHHRSRVGRNALAAHWAGEDVDIRMPGARTWWSAALRSHAGADVSRAAARSFSHHLLRRK